MATNNPYLNPKAYTGALKSANSTDGNVVATNQGLRPVVEQASNPTPATEIKPANSYKKIYNDQSLLTLTQSEMLIKLYDEIVNQLNIAIESIDVKRDVNRRNTALQKAQKIINHLRMTLDFQYEIANNLYSLYEYFVKCIVDANIKDDSKPLNDIIPFIIDLKDAYTEADKNIKNNKK